MGGIVQRPTIALCMIAKNEAHNLSGLIQSVRGCFDEIHITDTGSTDNTVEFIEQINRQIESGSTVWVGVPPISIHHFTWCDDFAKAREFSFSHAKTDYIMWMDCDDVLSDASKFIKWRDTVLHSAHYWLALYNYAFNSQGQVECKFIRERVIKRGHGFGWEYPVHEGIIQKEGKNYWPQRVSSWWINHVRTEEDKKQDHLRNLRIIEKLDLNKMPPRMKFYYGKELFENGFPDKAGKPLFEAISSKDLDIHDRLLGIQYAAYSAMHAKAYVQAIDLVMNGLRLQMSRAEYWGLLGDIHLAQGNVQAAIIAFQTALNCKPDDLGGTVVCYEHAYFDYPHIKLAEIMMNTGRFKEAEASVDALKSINHPSVYEIESRLEQLKDLDTIRDGLAKTKDVVITCPPYMLVGGWDENTLKEKGHGGSETAAIEVARWIKVKTGRPVKIFHPRVKREVMPSGVEYLPSSELAGYLKNIEPYAHIGWRHSTRLTKAKSYVWCHDLQCQSAERGQYDKIVALSEFHKNYLIETNGVDPNKVIVGFNGINPDDFVGEFEKDELKVVFSSSPDRGLIQSIDIVERARKLSGLNIKLHCFYGFENMRKSGHGEWADKIESRIRESGFVVSHGNVSKKILMKHFKEAAIWLYPADFIETYCITAIEALCAGAWPIVRPMGALPFTMKEAIDKGMCDMIDVEVTDAASVGIWANAVVEAIYGKKWKKVKMDPKEKSWEKVADFFIKELNLGA